MKAFHFLGFMMHQPAGNLLELLDSGHEKAHAVREMLLAYERPVTYAERYYDVARFCVCFSGVLLEQFQDPNLIDRVRDFIDIPRMLERYSKATNIELAGTGYYHPLFPLIPESHWHEHIVRGRAKVAEVFGRDTEIFWPPEMGFSCHMIPAVVEAGYRQVLCDGIHLRPKQPLAPAETIYRPHLAERRHDGKRIVVIPRDGQLSTAQQSGTDVDWFRREVLLRTGHLPQPALVTTCTDGENGGWFKNLHEPANFWGRFFEPYMERVRSDESVLIPTSLSGFLKDNPPDPEALAEIVPGTWEYDAMDPEATCFDDWARTRGQREVIADYKAIAEEFEGAERRARQNPSDERDKLLAEAFEQILWAEASDNLWKYNNEKGLDWLEGRARKALTRARELLQRVSSD